jgi:hypothetical protein
MLIRPLNYPDTLLLTPFLDIPRLRARQHETDIADALAAAEVAAVAVTAAKTGTYRLQEDRSVAITAALAARLAARATLKRRQLHRPARRLTRSEVVRALIVAASYLPLPAATGRGSKGDRATTVALPDAVDVLLSRLQPDGRIAPFLDRALASPDVVALATTILLLSVAEQDAFAYDTLHIGG